MAAKFNYSKLDFVWVVNKSSRNWP